MREHDLVLVAAVAGLQMRADVGPRLGARGGVRKRRQLRRRVLAAAGRLAAAAAPAAVRQVVPALRHGRAGRADAALKVARVVHRAHPPEGRRRMRCEQRGRSPRRCRTRNTRHAPVGGRPAVGGGHAAVDDDVAANVVDQAVSHARTVGGVPAARRAGEQVAVVQRRAVHLHHLHAHRARGAAEGARVHVVRHHPAAVHGRVRNLRRRGCACRGRRVQRRVYAASVRAKTANATPDARADAAAGAPLEDRME